MIIKAVPFLLFGFSIIGFAQEREPSYKFKLGKEEYTIFITQNSENKTNDTTFYNLYRVGKEKMIAKEIRDVTKVSTGEILAESYYNVGHDKITFYYSAKGKGVMEHVYTQNKKGTMTYKSAEIKIPPPEQVRVDFYNENKYEDAMVPVVAVYNVIEQVDEVAEYPGGIDKLRQFLANKIVYPPIAMENDVNGKVIATFIVEIDGSISSIKIINKLGFGCDEEVIRVLNLTPKWKAAQLNGNPVRSTFTLPVQFYTPE